jgi:hypothetical protein
VRRSRFTIVMQIDDGRCSRFIGNGRGRSVSTSKAGFGKIMKVSRASKAETIE